MTPSEPQRVGESEGSHQIQATQTATSNNPSGSAGLRARRFKLGAPTTEE